MFLLFHSLSPMSPHWDLFWSPGSQGDAPFYGNVDEHEGKTDLASGADGDVKGDTVETDGKAAENSTELSEKNAESSESNADSAKKDDSSPAKVERLQSEEDFPPPPAPEELGQEQLNGDIVEGLSYIFIHYWHM